MRGVPILLLLLLAACAPPQPAAPAPAPAPADHVLLISIDGLRPDFYLDSKYEAPTLRRLATRGAHAGGVVRRAWLRPRDSGDQKHDEGCREHHFQSPPTYTGRPLGSLT